MTRSPLVSLAVALGLAIAFASSSGCTYGDSDVEVLELRPGVFAATSTALLPLPVSGFELYVVGEVHGSNEIVTLLIEYLRRLHESERLCDVALEASPALEEGVEAFVTGAVAELPDLWYWALAGSEMIQLLEGIRALNDTLALAECIRVHLVDLDMGYDLIHRHLEAVHRGLGDASSSAAIPCLAEFQSLTEDEMLSLVDRLEVLASYDESVRAELQGLRNSIRFRFASSAGASWVESADACTAIRDGAIAQTVRSILIRSAPRPVLALFGAAHGQKKRIIPAVVVGDRVVSIQEPYWVERLTSEGIAVCSVLTGALSGFVTSHGRVTSVSVDPNGFLSPDGTSLAGILHTAYHCAYLYIDLRIHAAATFSEGFSLQTARFDPTVSAGDAFDGVVLFRRVTPAQ